MTSRHPGGMQPNHNAPNPAKYLKEMQALIPQLKEKGVIPMTREEARAKGLKSTTEAAIKADKEHQRRMDIISRRLDEYMLALSPILFRLVVLTGSGWWFKLRGYSYHVEATKETVQGVPNIECTRVYVYRRIWPLPRRTVKAERLVWQEPKPAAPAKAPKGKIIKLPGTDFEGKPHGGIILP